MLREQTATAQDVARQTARNLEAMEGALAEAAEREAATSAEKTHLQAELRAKDCQLEALRDEGRGLRNEITAARQHADNLDAIAAKANAQVEVLEGVIGAMKARAGEADALLSQRLDEAAATWQHTVRDAVADERGR